MSNVCLSADGSLGLRPCFACLDALVPRVTKLLGVTSTSAVSKPRTIATTTTRFTRSRDDATFGACRTDGRRRDCGCAYIGIGQTNRNTRKQSLLGLYEDLSTWR